MPGLLHHPLQLAQWCLALQNVHPPDLPVCPGAPASHAAEASANLAVPPVTLQSHPKSHHIWTLNQRVRTTTRQTLKQAQTQAETQAMKKMKAPPVGTLSMGTQIMSLTVRPGSPAGSGSSSGSCAHSTSTKSEDKEKKPSPMGKASSEADTDTSQTSLLPEIQSTDTEEEQRMSHQAFVHLMDEGFGTWWDQKIKDGLEQWSKQDVMICDHANPLKKAKSLDPLGAPIDYMESCGIFKPKHAKRATQT